MLPGGESGPAVSEDARCFRTTHWSVVLAAGQNNSPQADKALEQLCRTYWYPLYAYVRRNGHGVHDAQDLTQEFFSRLLQKGWLRNVHPDKGKFRSFLLSSMNHFLANEWRDKNRQKRGGGCEIFSLDAADAEDKFQKEPLHHQTPEKLFERSWAMTLLDNTMEALGKECLGSGNGELFEQLKGHLTSASEKVPHKTIGERLGMSTDAVKQAAHRMCRRYGELLRTQIAGTVMSPQETEEELHALLAVLSE